jgi:hypothetical protein
MTQAIPQRTAPGYIRKQEPDAVFAWFSTRRLVVIKDETTISLSADDLRRLRQFFDSFDMEPTP